MEIDDYIEYKLKFGCVYAMFEAFVNDTHIVYEDDDGWLINHYPNGKIERNKTGKEPY